MGSLEIKLTAEHNDHLISSPKCVWNAWFTARSLQVQPQNPWLLLPVLPTLWISVHRPPKIKAALCHSSESKLVGGGEENVLWSYRCPGDQDVIWEQRTHESPPDSARRLNQQRQGGHWPTGSECSENVASAFESARLWHRGWESQHISWETEDPPAWPSIQTVERQHMSQDLTDVQGVRSHLETRRSLLGKEAHNVKTQSRFWRYSTMCSPCVLGLEKIKTTCLTKWGCEIKE